MILTLSINGEAKTFSYSFIPMRTFRQLLEMQTRMNFDNLTPEQLDEVVTLICKTYGDKFSIDEFYDGLPVDKYDDTMVSFVNAVAMKKSHPSKEEGSAEGKPQASS